MAGLGVKLNEKGLGLESGEPALSGRKGPGTQVTLRLHLVLEYLSILHYEGNTL
jgi:hypothetical protein